MSNKSSVKQSDVAEIMNRINDAIENMGYLATAYDNTGIWLDVIIEGDKEDGKCGTGGDE